MKQTCNIHYGKELLALQIKKEAIRYELKPADIKIVDNISREVLRSLKNPINSKQLNEIVNKDDKIVILISDGISDEIARKLNFNLIKLSQLQEYLDYRMKENNLTVGLIHNSAETIPIEA